ncbi:efflux RND transporter periplasmic adaptor subunit [Penaeicola halotolerans]|uniref:efflux RND transporter periplasmic adaptor subunit n=1 Tax=Penaeicola halotolerans TaxID=2793196 RepID=UPI001CF90A51|nr:efflux RND transporter periplasmic adaptor subunit [Penaeicola halotolerans]
MKINKYISLTFWLPLLVACQNNPETKEQEVFNSSNNIILTADQIAAAQISWGALEKKHLTETFQCTGVVDVPPESTANITAPIGAFVKETHFYPGDYVKKGTKLATLQHPELIKMQQQFLELQSQHRFLDQEYERQKQLRSGDASSLKQFQEVENSWQITQASLASIKAQLELMGINTANISANKLISSLDILAPISGYITQNNLSIGKYMDPNQVMYQMIDKTHMHLELKVYEKDILKVKIGQKLDFTFPGSGDKSYQGEIVLIGQQVDPHERIILVHAHPEADYDFLRPGVYINATVYSSEEQNWALPKSAIIQEGGATYGFIKTSEGFIKTPIKIGASSGDWVSLIELSPEQQSSTWVQSGAYYIAASQSTEE